MPSIWLGKTGVKATQQEEFPKVTKCVHCKKEAKIAMTVCETIEDGKVIVAGLYRKGKGKDKLKQGDLWLHDYCAVSVYFCTSCLEPTALYNQR